MKTTIAHFNSQFDAINPLVHIIDEIVRHLHNDFMGVNDRIIQIKMDVKVVLQRVSIEDICEII